MDARDHLKGATVLVIDDDRAVLEATAALLRRWGCEVISRTEFPNPLPSVDIVLSDYDLPNDNGLSRLCELRQTQPQLLTALITGDPSQSLRREAEDAGVALLRKPVRPLQLRSLLLKLATTEL
jgi:CheY-like chemotaxis protein